jgi:hypothetical protein
MRSEIRLFLLVEGLCFAAAALVHFGVLLPGDQHPVAPYAEILIAAVLLVGLALTWVWPTETRSIGLAVQAFALLGTLVGLYTIAIGVGPRTILDLAYHVTIIVVLAIGLVVAARVPADEPTPSR